MELDVVAEIDGDDLLGSIHHGEPDTEAPLSAISKLPARVLYRPGALGELDALATEELGLTEGTEIEVYVEDGKLILERVPSAEHRRKVADALDRAMAEHRDVFAALAK